MRPTLSIIAPLAILAAIASGMSAQARPHPALADEDVRRAPAPHGAPVWVEAFVSRHRTAGTRADGWGGRVLWPLSQSALEGQARGSRSRLAIGAFAIRSTPSGRLGAWHVGAQADAVLPSPVRGGRLEPLVSLGAGAYRESLAGHRGADVPVVLLARPSGHPSTPIRALRPPRALMHAALSPGAALRVHLARSIALRAEARRIVVLDGRRRGTEVGVGLGLRR